MDMAKIGAFLASLRKENGLTQAQLGEKLGVEGKTVSRWETGTYLPPVEMLKLMSELYGVSMNEIVSGERLTDEAYRAEAEKNIGDALETSSFTLNEKIAYFKRKWRREHIPSIVLAAVFWIALCLVLKWQGVETYIIGGVGGALATISYGVLHNRMMIYVERNAYDGKYTDKSSR